MRKTNKRTIRKITGCLAILLLIILAVDVFYAATNGNLQKISDVLRISDVEPSTKIPGVGSSGMKAGKASISDIDLSSELALVNCENMIDESFKLDLTPAYRVIPLSTGDIEMDNRVLEAVDNMFEEAKKIGYSDFFVNSGFRSYQTQKDLFDKAKDKSYVQKPGASEHQTGYALDIAYKGLAGETFDDTPQGKWLIENAHKYGFILRYPEDKTEITNISYEPWHYRYVGLPHAYYCYQNDLCLEEYIDFLSKGGSYYATIDGTCYTVYYATEKDGCIDVPADKSYTVSSDNTGGYIVVIEG